MVQGRVSEVRKDLLSNSGTVIYSLSDCAQFIESLSASVGEVSAS